MSRDRGPWGGMPTQLPGYIKSLGRGFGNIRDAMTVNIFYRCSRSGVPFGVCNDLLQKDYRANRDGFKEYLVDVFGFNEEGTEKITKLLEEKSK